MKEEVLEDTAGNELYRVLDNGTVWVGEQQVGYTTHPDWARLEGAFLAAVFVASFVLTRRFLKRIP